MQKKNFWQIYFGKDPFSKAEFIKAWIGLDWMVGDCYCPARCTVDLYFIKFEGDWNSVGIRLLPDPCPLFNVCWLE